MKLVEAGSILVSGARRTHSARGRWLAAALSIAFALAAPGTADAAEPVLLAPNLAPQHCLHLTPPPDAAAALAAGHLAVALDAAYATVFLDEGSSGGDSVRLDMEVARVALRVARGLGGGWEAGAEVPYLWSGGGFFDGFVSAYHRELGLPDGGRDGAGQNEFTYELEVGGERYSPSAGAGLGDAVLWVKAALPSWGAVQWAVRGALKLPTGNPDRGLGSGRADAAAGLLCAAEAGTLRLAGSADVVRLGGSPDDALPLSTRWAFSGHLGAGLPLGDVADAVAQLSYFSTPYATGLSEVDRDVLTLAAGLRLRVSKRLSLSLGFTEDLSVGASPDFEVFLSLETH